MLTCRFHGYGAYALALAAFVFIKQTLTSCSEKCLDGSVPLMHVQASCCVSVRPSVRLSVSGLFWNASLGFMILTRVSSMSVGLFNAHAVFGILIQPKSMLQGHPTSAETQLHKPTQ